MLHSRPGVRIILALSTPMPERILETAKEGTRIRNEHWRGRLIDVLELRSAETAFHPVHGLSVTLPGETDPAATFDTSCFFEVQKQNGFRRASFLNPYFCERCGRVSGVCTTAVEGLSESGHERYRCPRCGNRWDGMRSSPAVSPPPVMTRKKRTARLQSTT